jgi:hypothetical protein
MQWLGVRARLHISGRVLWDKQLRGLLLRIVRQSDTEASDRDPRTCHEADQRRHPEPLPQGGGAVDLGRQGFEAVRGAGEGDCVGRVCVESGDGVQLCEQPRGSHPSASS